jgi:hypothetical protein
MVKARPAWRLGRAQITMDRMAHEQIQDYCNLCGKLTLFTRETYVVPHALHALITLFLAGIWLPVWILHALANSRSSVPFRCAQCGAVQGQLTIDQAYAQQLQREAQRRAAIAEGQVLAAGRRIRRAELAARAWAATKAAATWTWSTAIAAASGYARLVRRVAGEAEILFWFLWVLTAAVLIGLVGGEIAWIVNLAQ